MKFYLVLALLPFITACADGESRSASDAQPSASKIAAMYGCIDNYATVAVAVGYEPSVAIDAVEPFCEDEIDAYVDELITKTKRKNGWRSVQSSVPPAVRKNALLKMKDRMVPVYRSFQAEG